MIPFLRKHKRFLYVQGLFLLFTIMFSWTYIASKTGPSGDISFNWIRLRDAALTLLHEQLPQFDFTSNAYLGGAISTYYPWILITPILLLVKLFQPLTFMQLIIGFGFILGLEITYYSVRSLHKSINYAFSISVIYMMSTIALGLAYAQTDMGSFYSLSVMPLVIIGFIHWVRSSKWKMLSVGITLVCCANIAQTIVVIICLAITLMFFFKELNQSKVINLAKAVIATILCTSIIWLPILVLSLSNKVFLPSQDILNSTQKPLIFMNLTYYLIPSAQLIWGFPDALAIILAIIYWKKLCLLDKKFISISAILLFLNIGPVAKFLENSTILSHLQYMHRFSLYSHFLLSFVLVDILLSIVIKKWSYPTIKSLIACMIAFLMLMTFWSNGLTVYKVSEIKPRLSTKINYSLVKSKSSSNHFMDKRQAPHSYSRFYPDYFPASVSREEPTSKKFRQLRRKLIIPKKTYHYNRYNGYSQIARYDRYYQAPVVTYHTQKYLVKDNQKKIPYYSKNHIMYIRLHKGHNNIHFYPIIMWYRYLSIGMSLLGLSILCINKHKQ